MTKFFFANFPFEDEVEETYERKMLKCANLVAEVRERGWNVYMRPIEVAVREYVASLLQD